MNGPGSVLMVADFPPEGSIWVTAFTLLLMPTNQCFLECLGLSFKTLLRLIFYKLFIALLLNLSFCTWLCLSLTWVASSVSPRKTVCVGCDYEQHVERQLAWQNDESFRHWNRMTCIWLDRVNSVFFFLFIQWGQEKGIRYPFHFFFNNHVGFPAFESSWKTKYLSNSLSSSNPWWAEISTEAEIFIYSQTFK